MAGFVSRTIEKMYVKVFSRPSLQKINNRLLHLAMKGRGYNNYATEEETGELDFLKVIAKLGGGLCLDIGANTGRYSRALLQLPNTKVIAFEPLPTTFRKLEEIKKQFPDRFECVNVGVGNSHDILQLNYSEEESTFASFSKEVNAIDYVGKSNVNTFDVQITTVDSFLKERKQEEITLLKIDTEGFEYEVLTGAADTIKNNPPKLIQLEFNYHQLFRNQTLYALSQLMPGYQAYQLLPYSYGLAPRDPKQPESNFFYFSNFIFVRPDVVDRIQ